MADKTNRGIARFESGRGNTLEINFPKVAYISKGLWLHENKEEIKQTDLVFFGQSVRIQLTTKQVLNEREINITIKAKIGNEYVQLKDDEDHLNITLKVKNNQAISQPIYIHPQWYHEEVETYATKDDTIDGYNVKARQTYVPPKEALTFVFDAKLAGQKEENTVTDLPKDTTKQLVPVTYRRNYEELFGVYKYDDESGAKDAVNNYENTYIGYNTAMETLVNEFVTFMQTEGISVTAIKERVATDAKQLWVLAVAQQSKKLDDRPLYWARNKMQVHLKRHPLFKDAIDVETSIVSKNTPLEDIIMLFEELSRNYTGVTFSKAGNHKKILVTGFDPFQLDDNKKQSNPAGLVALALHHNNSLGAHIETMLFPVRYTDFDKSPLHNTGQGTGVVEKYIGDVLPKVDAIITVSQTVKKEYHVDVFATATRGGKTDNKGYTRVIQKALSATCPETIVSTLPKTFEYGEAKFYGKYFETKVDKDGLGFYNRNKKKIDATIEAFEYNLSVGDYDDKPLKYEKHKGFYDENKRYQEYLNSHKDSDVINYPVENIFSGPGSNYLSNEIFYRVAKLREAYDKELPTGHFHIAKIQQGTEGLDTEEAKKLLETVKETFTEGFKGI